MKIGTFEKPEVRDREYTVNMKDIIQNVLRNKRTSYGGNQFTRTHSKLEKTICYIKYPLTGRVLFSVKSPVDKVGG